MNPQDDYISIAEFAKLAGISPTAVYKKIRKQVHEPDVNQVMNYIKIVDGKKRISTSALHLFNTKQVDGVCEPACEPVHEPNVNQPVNQVKTVKGKKHISKATLSLFNTNKSEPVHEPSCEPDVNQITTILQETLDTLKGELEIKNKQIEQLNKQNDRLNDRLQEANQLNHQNQILLSEKQQPQPIEEPPATVKSPRWVWPWKRKGVDKE